MRSDVECGEHQRNDRKLLEVGRPKAPRHAQLCAGTARGKKLSLERDDFSLDLVERITDDDDVSRSERDYGFTVALNRFDKIAVQHDRLSVEPRKHDHRAAPSARRVASLFDTERS